MELLNATSRTLTSDSPSTRTESDLKMDFLPWRNPYNVISFETYDLIQKALQFYINPVIFCIGVPANVLNCVVFVRQGLKDRMNLCLFCLSVVDLLYMVTFTVSNIDDLVGLVRADVVEWWKRSVDRLALGLYRGFLLCSGCLTLIISVERCVCVFMPLKAASLMKTRTMALLIGSTVVVIQLLCVAFPLKTTLVETTDSVTNLTTYKLVLSALYVQNPAVFDVIQHTIIMQIIPMFSFTAVAIFTTITAVQLKRIIAWRDNVSTTTNATSTQQTALVKMLIIVCMIFVLSSVPLVALSITSSLEPEFFLNRRYNNIFLVMHLVHLELCMVNSSINFFVYVLRSSRFRRELGKLACLKGCFTQKKPEQVTGSGLVTGQC